MSNVDNFSIGTLVRMKYPYHYGDLVLTKDIGEIVESPSNLLSSEKRVWWPRSKYFTSTKTYYLQLANEKINQPCGT